MSIKTGLEYIGAIDPWTDEERLFDEEIVRCRDCSCFNEDTSLCNRVGKFPEWHACTEPNGFCAWGERREK